MEKISKNIPNKDKKTKRYNKSIDFDTLFANIVKALKLIHSITDDLQKDYQILCKQINPHTKRYATCLRYIKQYDQLLVIRNDSCTKQLAGFLAERSSHGFYLPNARHQWHKTKSALPNHSDEIVQESHLFPF